MKELGKIISIENSRGIVELSPHGGCKNCALNNICHATGQGKRVLPVRLRGKTYDPGDTVEIETPARSHIMAAFLVFILPLILSMTAYGLVYTLTKNQGYSLVGFATAFVLSEFLIAWIDKHFGKSRFFEPSIVQKLDKRIS